MKLEYVKEIPPRWEKRGYHRWIDILDEFQKSDEKILKITVAEGEYKRPQYISSSAMAAIRQHIKGGMSVTRRGWDLYIFKTI